MSSKHRDDDYARGSNTFRGMTSWQVWSITIVAVAVLLTMLTYLYIQ